MRGDVLAVYVVILERILKNKKPLDRIGIDEVEVEMNIRIRGKFF